MISLTIEAENIDELVDKLNAAMCIKISRPSNPAQTVAQPVAEPMDAPKKSRGRPPKKKPETIEAEAEEVKSEPEKPPADEPAESAEPDAGPTREQVKEAAYQYMEARMALAPEDKAAGHGAFQELLDAFDVERFSLLPEDKFAEAIEWAKAKTVGTKAEK